MKKRGAFLYLAVQVARQVVRPPHEQRQFVAEIGLRPRAVLHQRRHYTTQTHIGLCMTACVTRDIVQCESTADCSCSKPHQPLRDGFCLLDFFPLAFDCERDLSTKLPLHHCDARRCGMSSEGTGTLRQPREHIRWGLSSKGTTARYANRTNRLLCLQRKVPMCRAMSQYNNLHCQ